MSKSVQDKAREIVEAAEQPYTWSGASEYRLICETYGPDIARKMLEQETEISALRAQVSELTALKAELARDFKNYMDAVAAEDLERLNGSK